MSFLSTLFGKRRRRRPIRAPKLIRPKVRRPVRRKTTTPTSLRKGDAVSFRAVHGTVRGHVQRLMGQLVRVRADDTGTRWEIPRNIVRKSPASKASSSLDIGSRVTVKDEHGTIRGRVLAVYPAKGLVRVEDEETGNRWVVERNTIRKTKG